MTEHAISFGSRNVIVGVISDPGNLVNKAFPIVIILNAGFLHKVGPFRLSVDLARRLATAGFRTLRFDLSLRGDSLSTGITKDHGGDARAWAVSDIKEAMDMISKRYGIKQFVIIGLCAGADNAHRAAVKDERIVGTVNLDGLGYRNVQYYTKYYGERLINMKVLINKMKMLLSEQDKNRASRIESVYIPVNNRGFPTQIQAENEFKMLISRNVKMLYVYTKGVEEYYNYKNQLKDNFKSINFGKCLDLEYYPMAEHTYTRIRNREKVLKRIVDWMNANFASI